MILTGHHTVADHLVGITSALAQKVSREGPGAVRADAQGERQESSPKSNLDEEA